MKAYARRVFEVMLLKIRESCLTYVAQNFPDKDTVEFINSYMAKQDKKKY